MYTRVLSRSHFNYSHGSFGKINITLLFIILHTVLSIRMCIVKCTETYKLYLFTVHIAHTGVPYTVKRYNNYYFLSFSVFRAINVNMTCCFH